MKLYLSSSSVKDEQIKHIKKYPSSLSMAPLILISKHLLKQSPISIPIPIQIPRHLNIIDLLPLHMGFPSTPSLPLRGSGTKTYLEGAGWIPFYK